MLYALFLTYARPTQDLDSQRAVDPEQIKDFADSMNLHYVETSAANGQGCDEPLKKIAELLESY